jgi:hypothetical protein
VAALAPEEAVSRAREAAGVEEGVPGRAFHVRRLDRMGDAYYLVVFGEEGAAVAVATVGAASGEVGSSAELHGTGPHLEVDEARARELAGGGDDAATELVWRPSVVTKSALYPVWQVWLPDGLVYVSQSGEVTTEL